MLKPFTVATIVGAAAALKLHVKTGNARYTPNDKPWNSDATFVKEKIEAGNPFKDLDFHPNDDALGRVEAMYGSRPSFRSSDIEWKRLGELYDADKRTFFAKNPPPYSSVQQ